MALTPEQLAYKRRWRERNRERIRATAAARYAARREELLAYKRKWRAENPEKEPSRHTKRAWTDEKKATRAKWRAANRERVRATHRAWLEAHPEARAAYNERARARPRTEKARQIDRAGKARRRAADIEEARARDRKNALAFLDRRRSEWLRANGPCRHCGSWERLEVDHVDPATKISHSVWSWPDDERAAELAKCQPLCHECHATKTAAENLARKRARPIPHGTATGYQQHRARGEMPACAACLRANTDASMRYQQAARERRASRAAEGSGDLRR